MLTKSQQFFNAALESLREDELTISQEGFFGRLFTQKGKSLLPSNNAKYKHAIQDARREYQTKHANSGWVAAREPSGKGLKYRHCVEALTRMGKTPDDMVKAIDQHVATANRFLDAFIPLMANTRSPNGVAAVRNFHMNVDGLMNDRLVPHLFISSKMRAAERAKRNKGQPDELPALTKEQLLALGQRNLKLIDEFVAMRLRIEEVSGYADLIEWPEDYDPDEIMNRLLYTVSFIHDAVHRWLCAATR